MTTQEAMEIVKPWINEKGKLYSLIPRYLAYYKGNELAIIDGKFTADELEAIAIYMREGKKK